MIFRHTSRLSRLTSVFNVRDYSYKPIKRPDFNSLKSKTFVENKLKEYDLPQILKARIDLSGPITVAQYMREILTSPHSGYYMSKDVFGQKGDFITSPEIAQIFGEMMAVWCLNEYQKIGNQKHLQIVELGPGRGTLIQDILRVFSQFQQSGSLSIHLVEISPYLSKLQSQRMCFKSKEFEQADLPYYRSGEMVSGVNVYWYKRIEDVPNEFSIILAHEFFDALPIHKLQKDGNLWKEILIDIDPEKPGKFRYVISRNETPMSKLFTITNPDETRKHVEISPESDLIAKHIAERIESYGGFGLIVDYGHEGDKEDTFRSFKDHKLHDPLVDPGSADITADVDFRNLKKIFEADEKLLTFGPVEQRSFMKTMEAEVRLEKLLENATKEEKHVLTSSYEMLTSPDQMGSRFKFLSIFPYVLKDYLSKHPVFGF